MTLGMEIDSMIPFRQAALDRRYKLCQYGENHMLGSLIIGLEQSIEARAALDKSSLLL